MHKNIFLETNIKWEILWAYFEMFIIKFDFTFEDMNLKMSKINKNLEFYKWHKKSSLMYWKNMRSYKNLAKEHMELFGKQLIES